MNRQAAWTETRLGSILKVKHGYAFSGEFFDDDGPYVLLTPGNFKDEGGFKLKEGKEKFYTGPVPDGFLLKKGDLLIAMTEQAEGLLGSSAIVPEDDRYLHNQRLGLITDLDHAAADIKFIYYLFNTLSVRRQIRASASGTKVRHTAPSRICEVKINLPPVDLQRSIASILSAYDDLIENNMRRIAILEEMARRLYEEWFVRFRFPGCEKLTVASATQAIPVDWRSVRFTEIVDVLSGGTPRKDKPAYWNGAIPFYTPKDAPKFPFVLSTASYITASGLQRCNSQLYPKGTVFITARGSVGTLAIAGRDMAMNQSCYALRGRDGLPQAFVYFLTMAAVDQLRKRTHGAVFDTIIVETFRLLDVVRPSDVVVSRFCSLVEPMLDAVLNLIVQNIALHTARDLLLPKLIAGEIDVSNVPSPQKIARRAKAA